MIGSVRPTVLALAVVLIVCLVVDSGLANAMRKQRWRNGNGFYRRGQRDDNQEYSEAAWSGAGKCGYEVRMRELETGFFVFNVSGKSQ